MIARGANQVWTSRTKYPATMSQGSGAPVTMRRHPSVMPVAAPTATAARSPQGLMAPPETWLAFRATAISAGSAMVVAKPSEAPNR